MTEETPTVDGALGCEQRAYLFLERDLDPDGPPATDDELDLRAFDPDEVTKLIGLRPTRAWRRGDPGDRLSPRRFSKWQYEMPEVDTFYSEDVVVSLLDAIEPYAAGIAAACRVLDMRAGIMVVIWMRGGFGADDAVVVSTASISYTAQTVQRLARLGLSVHHDQYVELPEPKATV